MIPLPSVVKPADFAKARPEAGAKKNASPALPLVRRELLKEGTCAQILHKGPYAEERPTIEKLHAFIRENGLVFAGSHHEIYISDPNRSNPEKMKTIIRQPVKKARGRAWGIEETLFRRRDESGRIGYNCSQSEALMPILPYWLNLDSFSIIKLATLILSSLIALYLLSLRKKSVATISLSLAFCGMLGVDVQLLH